MTSKTKKSKLFHKVSPTKQLLLALGLFAVSVLASRPAAMTGWEETVFRALYGAPEFARPLVIFITQAGSIYFLGTLLLVFLAMQRYHAVLRLLLSGMLAYLVAGFAKDIWGRLRPHEILLNVINLDYVVRGPGFPSGHVALATVLALTVRHYLPAKFRWVVPVWIIGVAWSRIYLGVHAPLDIVGGFAIGWLAYALICHVRIYNGISRKKSKPVKNTRT